MPFYQSSAKYLSCILAVPQPNRANLINHFPHGWKLRRMWLNSTRLTPRLHFFNAVTKSETQCFNKFEAQESPNNPSACGWIFSYLPTNDWLHLGRSADGKHYRPANQERLWHARSSMPEDTVMCAWGSPASPPESSARVFWSSRVCAQDLLVAQAVCQNVKAQYTWPMNTFEWTQLIATKTAAKNLE